MKKKYKTCRTEPPNYGGIFDFDSKKDRLAEVERLLEDPELWQDPEKAQEIGKEKKSLEAVVSVLSDTSAQVKDMGELLSLATQESDDETILAIESDLSACEEEIAKLEFRRMFSNPMDKNGCFLDIQSGAGGTESQDWAAMLLRMYARYTETKDFDVEVLEESPGEVAGIKSAVTKISGEYAYGTLRTETGIHRLVRKSPFDSNAKRHTSFASVFVYPEVDDSIEVDINPAELRIDT